MIFEIFHINNIGEETSNKLVEKSPQQYYTDDKRSQLYNNLYKNLTIILFSNK